MTELAVGFLVAIFLIAMWRLNASKLQFKISELNNELVDLRAKKAALETITVNPNDVVSKDVHFEVIKEYKDNIKYLEEGCEKLIELNNKIKSELENKKSKERSEQVRLGQISEQIAPFLTNFPHQAKDLKPMFQPIDYVCFEEDKITFIEIKTGNSSLSTKQRNIKRLIEDNKVYFEVYRIK